MHSFRILVVLAFGYAAMADYRQDALNQHNELRNIHEAPSMTLDDELNTAAKEYARTLFDLGRLKHANVEGQGENLAMGCSTGAEGRTVQDAVKSWYDEVCDYEFDSPGFTYGTGHFTQLVWKGSTELGIGKYTGTKTIQGNEWTCTYIVARYKPAGNVQSHFSNNVVKGTFSSSYCDTVGDRSLGKAKYMDAPEGSTD